VEASNSVGENFEVDADSVVGSLFTSMNIVYLINTFYSVL
jgi:hypothetical protein